jgi:hypothetical protein
MRIDTHAVDLAVFVIADVVNLLLAGMFLARVWRRSGVARGLGTASVAMAIPLAAAVIWNAVEGRPLWLVALPVPFVVYCAAEWVLDYRLKVEFRSTRLLRPYLGLFYLGQIGLMSYAFSIGAVYGFVTLATYLICLAATGFSYSKVGHGVTAAE